MAPDDDALKLRGFIRDSGVAFTILTSLAPTLVVGILLLPFLVLDAGVLLRLAQKDVSVGPFLVIAILGGFSLTGALTWLQLLTLRRGVLLPLARECHRLSKQVQELDRRSQAQDG